MLRYSFFNPGFFPPMLKLVEVECRLKRIVLFGCHDALEGEGINYDCNNPCFLIEFSNEQLEKLSSCHGILMEGLTTAIDQLLKLEEERECYRGFGCEKGKIYLCSRDLSEGIQQQPV